MNQKWYGITYPFSRILCYDWILRLWEKYMCPKGYHLWDECLSNNHHDLGCDACQTYVAITEVTKWNYQTDKAEEI